MDSKAPLQTQETWGSTERATFERPSNLFGLTTDVVSDLVLEFAHMFSARYVISSWHEAQCMVGGDPNERFNDGCRSLRDERGSVVTHPNIVHWDLVWTIQLGKDDAPLLFTKEILFPSRNDVSKLITGAHFPFWTHRKPTRGSLITFSLEDHDKFWCSKKPV